jgi:hypothetical protein
LDTTTGTSWPRASAIVTPSSALAEKLSALLVGEYLGERAKRGDRRRFVRVLAQEVVNHHLSHDEPAVRVRRPSADGEGPAAPGQETAQRVVAPGVGAPRSCGRGVCPTGGHGRGCLRRAGRVPPAPRRIKDRSVDHAATRGGPRLPIVSTTGGDARGLQGKDLATD